MFDAADRAEALVVASRRIAASRHDAEIIALATEALLALTGAERVTFGPEADRRAPEVRARPPRASGSASTIVEKPVHGGGRRMGTFELRFDDPDRALAAETTSVIDLIGVVTGSALTMARAAALDRRSADPGTEGGGPEATGEGEGADRRTATLPDRRRMDRDFIDHSRAGQVGFVVFRIGGDLLTPTPTPTVARRNRTRC